MTPIIYKIRSLPFHHSLRIFLIKIGFLRLRTKIRLYAWRAEHLFFRLFRRKKKICIFWKQPSNSGLFAVFRYFLGGIAYADRKALLPVIDMKNTLNAYLYDDEVGQINSLEYYFEQPSGIALDEAEQSGQAIKLEIGGFLYPVPRQDIAFFTNQDGQLDYWRNICKRYIHFTKPVLERLALLEKKYSGRKILGVLLRGTDYIATRPYDHPIQPEPEAVIAKADEVMREKGFDAVYLATEDKNILEKFRQAFGEKLLLPDAAYIDYDYSSGKWLSEYHIDRDNDKYLQGLEYLVSMLFLSRLKGFITSMTSGSQAVMYLSEGFDYLYVFDLGLYH